jgi:hypothetical protein
VEGGKGRSGEARTCDERGGGKAGRVKRERKALIKKHTIEFVRQS